MLDSKRTLFVVAALTVASWAGASAARAEEAKGAELFAKNCAMCHGKQGKGDSKMGESLKIKNLTDPAVKAKLDKAAVTKAIKEGVKNEAAPGKDMKPLGSKFDDAQIAALAEFVTSLK